MATDTSYLEHQHHWRFGDVLLIGRIEHGWIVGEDRFNLLTISGVTTVPGARSISDGVDVNSIFASAESGDLDPLRKPDVGVTN